MSRSCTICQHPHRAEIDHAIVTGEQGYRLIASRFVVGYKAIERHKAEHLPASLIKAKEADAVTQADSLLAQVQHLHATALHLLVTAEAAGDLRTALAGVREARGCLELEAKIRGEIDERPQVNIALSLEWQAARTVLLQALAPHPAARRDVVAALLRIEAGSSSGNGSSSNTNHTGHHVPGGGNQNGHRG